MIDYSKPVKNGPDAIGFDYYYGHCGSLDMAPYVYVENGRVTAPAQSGDGQYRLQRLLAGRANGL